ncbi:MULTISPECIES: hypothetical protein [Streptomyces]|uniref:hypothetical protein n=1 Tax=Streptomyces TaxID=1883 RepID=UPI000A39DDCB|nr:MULTISPECIES: hypothetical protein [Streptomyces]QTI90239.1 hypothetical protein AS97_58620 [Streptomyces sp. AgN23]RSS45550.1 hypothetical protein EF902_13955 [Streptomyces sp. WAC05858]WJD96355.1 hypothetical protein QR300_10355 [Streptomyces antimycoticus]WTA86357.1 hypothetical protein OG751_44515 [Streptomyces antimycoticus]WTB03085.1 hypothetical protein OG546_01825 [Streptomyces antimycoticus]
MSDTSEHWNTFGDGRTVTPAEFVAAAAALLDGAVHAVSGPSAEIRADLVAGLEATLDPAGPYATLRLDTSSTGNEARRELAASAAAAGALILDLVRAGTGSREGRAVADLRSPCVGYGWTPAVVDWLMGAAGGHPARNLYNEWLYQLVLLRDALIPFDPSAETRLLVMAEGLRGIADERDRFVLELTTRRIAHRSVVRFAAAAVLGEPGPARPSAYGFQWPGGSVLPAVVSRHDLLAPRYQLSWSPDAVLDGEEHPLFFVPAAADYLELPRRDLADLPPTSPSDGPAADRPVTARLVRGPSPADAGTATLDLAGDPETGLVRGSAVSADGWRVDLGQALRGHRYALRPDAAAEPGPLPETTVVPGRRLLPEPVLFTAAAGRYRVLTEGDPLLALAALGRIHPDANVLYSGQNWPSVRSAAHRSAPVTLLDLRP